jgi:hypothetical protein
MLCAINWHQRPKYIHISYYESHTHRKRMCNKYQNTEEDVVIHNPCLAIGKDLKMGVGVGDHNPPRQPTQMYGYHL